ncbi:MAG: type II secretion system F family protein [Rhodopila sp.]|jgi:tight adherence protein B
MTLPPAPLLLAGALLLLLCFGARVLLARITATEATAARTLTVTGPYQVSGARERDPARSLLDRLPLLEMRLSIARLFGIDLKRRAEYPVRWWILLAGTLAAARAACWLIAMVVDFPQLALVPPLWLLFSRMVFGYFGRRRLGLLFQQFPDALAMVVRALRAGQTVAQSLRGVAQDAPQPTAIAFIRLADRLAIGVPLSEALPELAADSGLTEYRFFATALMLQSQTGGSLTEALDTLAEVIRTRVALRRRAYAMAGEARASAIVLSVMPVVTFLVMMLVAPDYARLLLDDKIGRRVLGAAIGMLLVGGGIMNGMIRSLLR